MESSKVMRMEGWMMEGGIDHERGAFSSAEIFVCFNPFPFLKHKGGVALGTEIGHCERDAASFRKFRKTVDHDEEFIIHYGTFCKREGCADEIRA